MYVKGSEYCKLFKVHPSTLRRWADTGKLACKRTPGGIRLYELPREPVAAAGPPRQKTKVVYARVSSAKQKDDLQRQADFLRSKFPDHQLVTDVGSGVNWKRKGLLALLDASHRGDLEELVVASRDRLCRFAFDLLAVVFRQRGTKLVVLDAADASPEQELSDDLLSIVQIFKRRYGAATAGQDGAADAQDQAEPDGAAEAGAEPVRKRRAVHV